MILFHANFSLLPCICLSLLAGDSSGNCHADVCSLRIAAQIGSAGAICQDLLDGVEYRIVGCTLPQKIQHQCARPDHGDRVGDVPAAVVIDQLMDMLAAVQRAYLGV